MDYLTARASVCTALLCDIELVTKANHAIINDKKKKSEEMIW